jgi:hypothetical protein
MKTRERSRAFFNRRIADEESYLAFLSLCHDFILLV